MTDPETDLQADALLLAVIEREGGDLHAAFAVLCARVSPGDLACETFERALGRAVRALFVQRPYPLGEDARPRDLNDAVQGGRVQAPKVVIK